MVTVNFFVLVAVPPLVVTLSLPVFALLGTVALIFVAEATLKAAFRPANLTAVAPLKFLPVIVTFVPTLPLAGEKLLIAGFAGFAGAASADPTSAEATIINTDALNTRR